MSMSQISDLRRLMPWWHPSRRSFDHPVGAQEYRLRNPQALLARSREIHDQLDYRRLLDWQIRGLGAAQNAICILRCQQRDLGYAP